MKQLVGVALIVGLGLAGCADDGAQVTDDAAAQTVPAGGSLSTATTGTTATSGDFGSRYVGAPVAFWFWAPY